MISKLLFSLVILFLATESIFAQTASLGFILGLPQNEFAKNNENIGYGFHIQATYPATNESNPFALGIDFGYLIYGSESFKRPFSLTNPDVTVDVNRNYNLLNFHVVFQVSPYEGTFQPYLELLGGGKYLFTTTEIQSENTSEEVSSSTNFDDFAWSYGFGGGTRIRIGGEIDEVKEIFLDLKLRYVLGSEAEYLTEGGVIIDESNSTVSYAPKRSKTDILTIHLGCSFTF